MNAPVRMVWDRAESIRGHGKRHPFRIRHALGADRRGQFVAARVDLLADAGCYASTSAAVLANAMSQACGPYAVPNVEISGRAVYTNNPYTCAFRGFGVNQVTFAMEQQVNKLAHALGIAPEVIRRRNFVRAGGQLATGPKVFDCAGLVATLSAATMRARRRPLPRRVRTGATGAEWRARSRTSGAASGLMITRPPASRSPGRGHGVGGGGRGWAGRRDSAGADRRRGAWHHSAAGAGRVARHGDGARGGQRIGVAPDVRAGQRRPARLRAGPPDDPVTRRTPAAPPEGCRRRTPSMRRRPTRSDMPLRRGIRMPTRGARASRTSASTRRRARCASCAS